MELNEAKEIVRALANGIDPTTGEVLPETSPYSNPKIIRALFALLEPTATEKKPKRSVDEKQRENEQLGKPRNAGLPWTDEQREQLATLFRQGTSLDEMAHRLARRNVSMTLRHPASCIYC
jgi:hypothetical protein